MAQKDANIRIDITADGSKARAEIKGVEKAIKELGSGQKLGDVLGSANSQFGGLGATLGTVKSGLSSLAVPGGIATATIAGIGAAAVGAGKELFDLAKQGSDLGRSFASFQAKTGLSAVAVSTLADAAHLSGKELSDIQRPLTKFNELLVKAQTGSKDAGKELNTLGVTNLKDLDTALDQVSRAFNDSAGGQAKLHAAVALFGAKGGPDFISVLAKMKGGFFEAQEEARRLGVTLTEDDLKAAKEFGKAWDTVGRQVEIGVAKFALTYASQITGAIQDISKWLGSNQDVFRSWGVSVANVLRGITGYWDDLTAAKNRYWGGRSDTEDRSGIGGVNWGKFAVNLTPLGFAYNALSDRGERVPKGSSPGSTYDWLGVRPESPAEKMLKMLEKEAGADKGGGAGKAAKHDLSPQAKSIVSHAEALGISPLDFATLLLYEGAGQLSTSIMGGKGGKYLGSMQMGPWEQSHYGVKRGMSWSSYLDKASQFLIDRGVRPGADLLTLYKAVNGGNVGVSANASDGNGTIRQHVERMLAQRSGQARSLLGMGKGGGDYAAIYKAFQEQAQKEFEQFKAIEDARAAIGKATSDQIVYGREREIATLDKAGRYEDEIVKVKELTIEKRNALDDELVSLEKLYDKQTDSDKKAELRRQIDLKTIEIQTAKIKLDDQEADAVEELTKKIEDQAYARLKLITAMSHDAAGHATQNAEHGTVGAHEQGPRSVLGQAIDDLYARMGAVKDIKSSFQELGMIGVVAFENMTAAVGSSIEQWALYGGSVGQALKKALAAELAHIAGIATIHAIEATALGFLRLAQWDFVGAGHAFMSAGIWAGIAGGTALGARALSKGSGAAGTGSSGYGAGASSAPPPAQPISRMSSNAYISGRDPAIHALTQTVQNLDAKISSMRPGDVVTVAAQQNPGIMAEHVIRDVENNSSHGTRLLRASGYR